MLAGLFNIKQSGFISICDPSAQNDFLLPEFDDHENWIPKFQLIVNVITKYNI